MGKLQNATRLRWHELFYRAKAQIAGPDFDKIISHASSLIVDTGERGEDWDGAYWRGIGYLEAALGLTEAGMVGADEYDEIIAAQDLMREV